MSFLSTGKLHSNYVRGSFAFARSGEILQVLRPRFHRRGHLVHRDGSCECNPNQGRRRQARRQEEEIIPKSVKVTLQFRVVRFARFLKKGRYAQAQRMGTGAPIYMASVLEYLAAEVLELPLREIYSSHMLESARPIIECLFSSNLRHSRDRVRLLERKEICNIDGRWCISSVAARSPSIQGLLLVSGAGAGNLVEPLSAVPLNDELQQARESVAKAEQEVLLKITKKMQIDLNDIENIFNCMIQIDTDLLTGGTDPIVKSRIAKKLQGKRMQMLINPWSIGCKQ
ncbi:uncharacterized protein LOC131014194 isoform X3 [Salvia miltiorrhiza]|uniref:uncharacterized protein LOC131014194 isoform X3 n=1 Tax=Salvia miltiorrhiza TaxID=226208 RepID=UPI0025AC8344|nr:uncharacterized protein LOC131014194 isoform X3 [Salvia miltiorrhiza]